MENIRWDYFNEGQGLIESVERYRIKYGYYPEAVLADKLYRNRKNMEYCKEHGIRLSGSRLGRPPKDEKRRKGTKNLNIRTHAKETRWKTNLEKEREDTHFFSISDGNLHQKKFALLFVVNISLLNFRVFLFISKPYL